MRLSLMNDPDAEGWDDVGFTGPGPDHVLVPDTTTPGTYRLCTVHTPAADRACALLHVAP